MNSQWSTAQLCNLHRKLHSEGKTFFDKTESIHILKNYVSNRKGLVTYGKLEREQQSRPPRTHLSGAESISPKAFQCFGSVGKTILHYQINPNIVFFTYSKPIHLNYMVFNDTFSNHAFLWAVNNLIPSKFVKITTHTKSQIVFKPTDRLCPHSE